MHITRLDHYNIRAPQAVIDAVVVFYREVLALTPGPRPDFGIPGVWLYQGAYPIVHLTVDEAAVAPAENTHFNHVAFRCVGLKTYLDRLAARRVAYTAAYISELEMTQVFFFDPAGIQIELDFLNETTDGMTPPGVS
ncbi:MAG: hypothetical protein QNJ22_00165 [Desulfosarcinaceae bacterium]|nr:hypothetical protein [Desulfosarcinaceae bacterium]